MGNELTSFLNKNAIIYTVNGLHKGLVKEVGNTFLVVNSPNVHRESHTVFINIKYIYSMYLDE